uniref:Uncharacterized protein n=1 Tax=Branchiostoma floridae TaxID=7739 RepID=C3YVR2_BRAFL|eukprot:XP_002599584.1 hypothetical protein BRAFLDRAFT_77684 [Branchiostoma floridae]
MKFYTFNGATLALMERSLRDGTDPDEADCAAQVRQTSSVFLRPREPSRCEGRVAGQAVCASLWYTLDERYEELSHHEARQLVESLLNHEGHENNETMTDEL